MRKFKWSVHIDITIQMKSVQNYVTAKDFILNYAFLSVRAMCYKKLYFRPLGSHILALQGCASDQGSFFDLRFQIRVYILGSDSGQALRQGQFSAKLSKYSIPGCKVMKTRVSKA